MEIRVSKGNQIKSTQGIEARIVWNPKFIRNVDNAFGRGNQLQKFIDATILESIEPYLPRDTGELVTSGKLNTVIGSGRLIWKTPYARYLYYGMLMVDPVFGVGAFHDPVTGRFWSRRGVRKVLTDVPLKFRGGGKRGSFWAERYLRDNLSALEKNIQLKAGELLRL